MADANPNANQTKKATEAPKTPTPAELAATAKKQAQQDLRKKNEKSRKAAQEVLHKFMDHPTFKTLTDDVKKAVERLSTKPGGGASGIGGFPSSVSILTKLFPAVGTSISELDIFRETKKGRSEFRKYTKLALKRAKDAERMWFKFDATKEEWTLIAVGVDAPKDYDGPAIPVKREAKK